MSLPRVPQLISKACGDFFESLILEAWMANLSGRTRPCRETLQSWYRTILVATC